jgi:hypothetical protein
LPEEIVGHIFGCLDTSDLFCGVALVCKEWNRLENAVRKYRQSLDLATGQKNISDNILTRLCSWFPCLTSLNLFGLSKISDSSMHAVGTLTNLRCINFMDTAITDEGLAQLSALCKLEKVFLSESQTSLRPLAKFTNLTALVTIYQGIRDESLCHLSLLTKLENLSCRSARKITGKFLTSLWRLKNLTFLSLGSNVDPKYLPSLSQFTKLISLDIHNINLTLNEVQSLAILTRLRFLNISGNIEGFDDSVLSCLFVTLTKLECLDLGFSRCLTKTTLCCLQRLTKKSRRIDARKKPYNKQKSCKISQQFAKIEAPQFKRYGYRRRWNQIVPFPNFLFLSSVFGLEWDQVERRLLENVSSIVHTYCSYNEWNR